MKNIQFQLASTHENRPFLADATFVNDGKPKPLVVFNHGFKGYKDWGPFHLIAQEFARNGFVFIKMNFSFNGTTLEQPAQFADLDAFGNNNFAKELDDTKVLLDALFKNQLPIEPSNLDLNKLYLIGHSRGGASIILKANEDARVKKIVTWAGVNNLEIWHTPEELEMWKKLGTIYIQNSRTNQQMPLHYQIVENYQKNKDRLEVPKAIRNLKIPMLAIHGTEDETVSVEGIKQFKVWNETIQTKIIDGANHTFGATEPWSENFIPDDFKEVIDLSIGFLKA